MYPNLSDSIKPREMQHDAVNDKRFHMEMHQHALVFKDWECVPLGGNIKLSFLQLKLTSFSFSLQDHHY